MGLFDWLTDGIGSSQGPAFEGSLMPGMGPSDAPPMPPNAVPPSPDPAVDAPPPLPGPAAGIPVPAPRPEGAPPLPMLAARTAGAPSQLPPLPPPTPTGQSALPPNATPTSGLGMPPGPPTPLSPAQAGDAYSAYRAVGGGGPVSIYGTDGSVPGGGSAIGRALGLDANKERSLLGGLGAAMTAAGNSAGKTKGQAFFSGVGAGLQGSEKTEQELNKEQQGYLKNAISAMQAGNTAEATKSLVQLRIAQTQKAQQEAIDLAQGSGKDNVANSRQQLILRADKQALGEAQVSANGVKQALSAAGGNLEDPGYKKALAEHNDRLDAIKQQKYKELGITPKEAEKLGKMQGMSVDNPAQPKTLADMQKLPVGAYYIPSPGAPLMVKLSPEQLAARKAAASGGAGGAIPAVPTAPAAPTAPEAADDEYQHAL